MQLSDAENADSSEGSKILDDRIAAASLTSSSPVSTTDLLPSSFSSPILPRISILRSSSSSSASGNSTLSQRNPLRCKHAPKDKIFPKGGYALITFNAVGSRTFWCNNGTLVRTKYGQLHGASKAVLRSTNGLWNGRFMNRPKDGRPQLIIIHRETGKKRVVIAQRTAASRRNSPDGQPLSWERRRVEMSSGGMTPVYWLVRSHTKSGVLPTSCKGDIDVIVPFAVQYRLIVC